MKVITELFNRGDIVRADSLKPPSETAKPTSSYSLQGLRSSLTGYLWGSSKPTPPSLDDPIVPVAALKAAAERAASLSGPMASSDLHTVKTFAAAITADSTRDAEAVIAHIVSKGDAVAVFTDASKDNPEPVFGVKLGRGTGAATDKDKGVLRTKAALENMEEMAGHLEVSVEAEKNAAAVAARSGNKTEALGRLRKKKVLESKLSSARSAAAKLSDVLMAVDEAESNREAVLALETGMESLRLANKDGVTADRVDSVAADFDDMMAEQQDVRMALEQINADSVDTEAQLEAELEELVAGKEEVEAAVADVGKSKLDDEAELELAQLLAELPTPTPYNGKEGNAVQAEGSGSATQGDGDKTGAEDETAASGSQGGVSAPTV